MAEKQISNATKEFEKSTVGMKDWQKSIEGVEAKTKQLSNILVSQNQKLAGLKAEYKKVAEEQGASSEAALKLQQQIKRQQTIVNATQKEFLNYSETLDKAKKGVVDLQKVSLKGGKAVKETGDKAKESGDGFTIARGAIANFISNGLTALVGACKNAISSILGLSEATREYRTNAAKLETSFESAGHSAETAKDTYKELYSVLGDEGQATEAAQHLAELASSEEDLTKLTNGLTGVYAKFGASLPIEGLAEAANESAKVGKVTGSLADAINWTTASSEDWTRVLGGNDKALKAFNKAIKKGETTEDAYSAALAACTTEQERQSLITNTLNGLYGDQADAFKETNKNVIEANKAQADFSDAQAELGAKVEPITTKIREGYTRILEKVLELVDGVDLDAFAGKIEKAFDGFINDTIPKIVNAIQWIIDNKDILTVIATAIGIVTGALAALNIVLGIQSAIMAANPTTWIIMGIIAAVTLLVTAILLAIKHWDKIKAAGAAAWEWIKQTWSKAGEWFSNIGKSISESVSKAWQNLKQGASDAWQGVKNTFSKVGSFFGDTFRKAWEGVKKVFSTGGKIFDGIKDGITSAFKNIVNAIIRGINKVVAVPFNAINKTLDKIRTVEIAGFSPFSNLISKISVPEIPELYKGGVLKKGQIGLLEGKGAEAVVPLEKNTGWIKRIASELSRFLNEKGVKGDRTTGASEHTSAGAGGRVVNIDARQTLNYNGKMSLKETKQAERNHYVAVRTKLRLEGLV